MKKLFTMLGICLLFLTACVNENKEPDLQEYLTFTFSNQLGDTCTVGDLLTLPIASQIYVTGQDRYILTIRRKHITYLLFLEKIGDVIIPTYWEANRITNIEWKSFELRMYNTYMESKFFTSGNQLDSSITKTK